MTRVELLDIVDDLYDGGLRDRYGRDGKRKANHGVSNPLAAFLVAVVTEAYKSSRDDGHQLDAVARTLRDASDVLAGLAGSVDDTIRDLVEHSE